MGYGKFKFVVWTDRDVKTVNVLATLEIMSAKYNWTYLIASLENCPTTGKAHVDGYYEYDCPRNIKTENNKFTKTFGKGFGDIQTAYGSAGENYDYSTKEGKESVELGHPAAQGEKRSLGDAKIALLDGTTTVDQLCLDNPELYHQYGRTLEKLEDIKLRKMFRTEMTTCEWLVGPTGAGKSHKAFEGYHPETHYLWKLNDNGWQDGYTGQETVIINDFRGEIKYNELLNMIDKWPFTVSRRAREPVPFLAKHVIITTSLYPAEIYTNRVKEDKLAQLYRRIQITKLGDRSEF